MTLTIRNILTTFFIIFLITGFAKPNPDAQVELQVQPGSEMTIFGSANIQDWEADVTTINGSFIFHKPENSEWHDIEADWFQSAELTMPVEDIESGSSSLTNNIHDYLEKDDHPEIRFQLNHVSDISNINDSENEFNITAMGEIEAAGATHNVELSVSALMETGNIQFTGAQDLKMTDFDIDPPTAMFGTIRARDDMNIEFDINVE